MPVPTITPLPTAPSRFDEPTVFVTRADAFVGALGDLASDMNTALEWVPQPDHAARLHAGPNPWKERP